jgi:hypothetical protein
VSTPLNTDPAYHDGFFDAKSGEPLFPDASASYEAGWRALWKARQILLKAGFSEQPDGMFTKQTVVAPSSSSEKT